MSPATIPLLPVGQALAHPSTLHTSRVLDRLREVFHELALREPPPDDPARWHEHRLAGRTHRFARPLTLTPYASVRPCSARCRFCSENLRDDLATGPPAASLRPGPGYFAHLRAALAALDGVPLSYSLSGLESTDDPDWLLALLRTLGEAGPGPVVEGSVLYTNGAGLAHAGAVLLPALAASRLFWIEWSRHHDHPAPNQRIMRFREGQAMAEQGVFERAVGEAARQLPVKMVCVVQRGGIETAADAGRYADWARSLGASAVIFREFSALPARYRPNATRRYVDDARVAIDDLLLACLDDPHFRRRHAPVALTGGYYFWNARWQRRDGFEVVFEKSDYGTLLEQEASGRVYKLVFHANGNLCAGWQPDRDILWSATPHGRQ